MEWAEKQLPGKNLWAIIIKSTALRIEEKEYKEWARSDEKVAGKGFHLVKRRLERDTEIMEMKDKRLQSVLLRLRARTLGLRSDLTQLIELTEEEGRCPLCGKHKDDTPGFLLECEWPEARGIRKEWMPKILLCLSEEEKAGYGNPKATNWHKFIILISTSKRNSGKLTAVASMAQELWSLRKKR
jgi:hypothetical protein